MASQAKAQMKSKVETTFVEEYLESLPLLGQYAAPLLLNKYTLPLTKKADPLVKSGVERAAPYVEKAKPLVSDVLARAQSASESIRAAPARAVATVQAAPKQIYETGVSTARSVSERVQSTAQKAKQTTTETAAAVKEQVVAALAKASKLAKDAVVVAKELPARSIKAGKEAASKAVTTAKATTLKVQQKTLEAAQKSKLALKSTLDAILAAPKKVYNSITASLVSAAKGLADRAQPVVHRAVNIATPYAKATAENERVNKVYKHRIVQGSIEKVSPLVSKVAKQPTLVDIAKQVSAWALPAM